MSSIESSCSEPKRQRVEEEEGEGEKEKTKEMTAFESLPPELAGKIFELVPEEVLALRLVSPVLKQKVDEFAKTQTELALAERVSFSTVRLPIAKLEPDPNEFSVHFRIGERVSRLFYLRLLLNGRTDFTQQISAMAKQEFEHNRDREYGFDLNLDIDDANTPAKMALLREYIGQNIEQVNFHCVSDEKVFGLASTMLESTKFKRMRIVTDVMTETIAENMRKNICRSKVEHLILTGRFDTTMNTVPLLRRLSTYLRSLHIWQTAKSSTEGASAKNHFFGANDTDWFSTLIDMFAGSLDKICFNNPTYDSFLNATTTNSLIKALPLLEKKVHFVASCNQYPEGLDSDGHKNYVVKVNAAPAANGDVLPARKHKQYLQIMHKSRAGEPAVDPRFTIEEGRKN